MKFNNFTEHVQFGVNSGLLWLIFFVALILFAVSCLVYVYHWRSYGTNDKVIKKAQYLYLGVGITLLAVNAFCILIIP